MAARRPVFYRPGRSRSADLPAAEPSPAEGRTDHPGVRPAYRPACRTAPRPVPRPGRPPGLRFGRRSGLAALVLTLAAMVGLAGPARAQVSEEQALVDRAQLTFQSMARDPNLQAMTTYARAARAVLIVPEMIRGGFFVGGAGGIGVILERQPDGGWSPPAFYTLAGGSLGLQIGGQVSEVVLAIMTDEGLRAVQEHRVTLGADVSVAAATVGIGRGASTGLEMNADMYAFSRNQGLYLGGALEGTVMTPAAEWNRDYYGPGANAMVILSGQVSNPGADGLRLALPR